MGGSPGHERVGAMEQLTVVDDALYGQLLAVRTPRAITMRCLARPNVA
jgi:hypothetical protein